MNKLLVSLLIFPFFLWNSEIKGQNNRPRIIVTTDGEADDRASMIRLLLTANEFDIEGIINSSSEFHWVGGKGWNAFHPTEWIKEYIDMYSKVYPNLKLHDPNFPSPTYLLNKWKVGNINGIGEDEIRTEGAELIVKVILEKNDTRPIWIQAWGGCNTISQALKIIQKEHPDRMKEAADKIRLFLIWEQDKTYQQYIRPNWESYNIPTVISDQFDCLAYIWPKVLPQQVKPFFDTKWITENILNGHGPLCAIYENKKGAFNAEGDTPAFLHNIPTGLRSMESPAYGGWGGQYELVRNNVWMDLPPDSSFKHPDGQWGFTNSWSKKMEKVIDPDKVEIRTKYFKQIWRWLPAVQSDFAARADWCIKDYKSANHHPIVKLKNTPLNIKALPGSKIKLDASATSDPDGDILHFKWWNYQEAGTYKEAIIPESNKKKTFITIPKDALPSQTIHIICEVSDSGTPVLTRYQRVIITVAGKN